MSPVELSYILSLSPRRPEGHLPKRRLLGEEESFMKTSKGVF